MCSVFRLPPECPPAGGVGFLPHISSDAYSPAAQKSGAELEFYLVQPLWRGPYLTMTHRS